MKLRNKKTGEIGFPYFQNWKEITCVIVDENAKQIAEYTSLAELNEEWEDYEEPKEYWCISENGVVGKRPYPIGIECVEQENRDEMREIGNYFNTEEEAKKALEKLKAITKLKSCGFKFRSWRTADLGADKYYFVITAEADGADKGDLDLLFSGGEE